MVIFVVLFGLFCINYNNCTYYLHQKFCRWQETCSHEQICAVTHNLQYLHWPAVVPREWLWVYVSCNSDLVLLRPRLMAILLLPSITLSLLWNCLSSISALLSMHSCFSCADSWKKTWRWAEMQAIFNHVTKRILWDHVRGVVSPHGWQNASKLNPKRGENGGKDKCGVFWRPRMGNSTRFTVFVSPQHHTSPAWRKMATFNQLK